MKKWAKKTKKLLGKLSDRRLQYTYNTLWVDDKYDRIQVIVLFFNKRRRSVDVSMQKTPMVSKAEYQRLKVYLNPTKRTALIRMYNLKLALCLNIPVEVLRTFHPNCPSEHVNGSLKLLVDIERNGSRRYIKVRTKGAINDHCLGRKLRAFLNDVDMKKLWRAVVEHRPKPL